MKVKLNFETEIQVPRVPSFIRYGKENGQTIDIAKLSDEHLMEIGGAWTAALIVHAKFRRDTAYDQESKKENT